MDVETRDIDEFATVDALTLDARLHPAAFTANVPAPADDTHDNLSIYDIQDCLHPKFVQQIGYGSQIPHEFFVWKDPNRPTRFLIYQSFSSGAAFSGNGTSMRSKSRGTSVRGKIARASSRISPPA